MFNGIDSVNITYSSAFDFETGSFAISMWVKYSPQPTSGEHVILRRDGSGLRSLYGFNINGQTNVLFEAYDSQISGNFSVQRKATPSANCSDGQWHFIVGIRNGNILSLYNDGVLAGSTTGVASFNFTGNANELLLGQYIGSQGGYYTGAVDDVHIYNRALSANEVLALYQQYDPSTYSNYYYFTDPLSNNTMIVNVNSPNANIDNSALVTCTDFFTDNKLDFQANSSLTMKVWTNLGQPLFIENGVWNSQNYTTTFTLDASSTGELDWNRDPPSASNFFLSSTIIGKTAAFSSLWSDSHSLTGGGFVFSSNNTGQWVNASWAAFSSTPCWGNASLTLNSKAGVVVGFREYGNNSLNVWADSGLYTITTTNDSSCLSPSPSPSSTPSTSPTPTPTSTLSPTASPPPSQTPIPTPMPKPIPIQNNLLSHKQ